MRLECLSRRVWFFYIFSRQEAGQVVFVYILSIGDCNGRRYIRKITCLFYFPGIVQLKFSGCTVIEPYRKDFIVLIYEKLVYYKTYRKNLDYFFESLPEIANRVGLLSFCVSLVNGFWSIYSACFVKGLASSTSTQLTISFEGTLRQIWKSLYMIAFIWK